MATIKHPVKIVKEVKPTIVSLNISINKEGSNPKDVVNNLTSEVSQLRDFISYKSSTRKDSGIKQSNMAFNKRDVKEDYFEALTLGIKREITMDEYERLDIPSRKSYVKKTRIVQTVYVARVNLHVILDITDQVIDDFTSIINYTIEHKLKTTYDLDILPEEREQYLTDLYIDCVNKGMKEIRYYATKINDFNVHNVKLLYVNTIDNSHYGIAKAAYSESVRSLSSEPEQYFIPEFVKELFNNNINLTKEIELEVEV